MGLFQPNSGGRHREGVVVLVFPVAKSRKTASKNWSVAHDSLTPKALDNKTHTSTQVLKWFEADKWDLLDQEFGKYRSFRTSKNSSIKMRSHRAL